MKGDIVCTNPQLDALMRDLWKSRNNFIDEFNENQEAQYTAWDLADLIDTIKVQIMNKHFKDCFVKEDSSSRNGKEKKDGS